MGISSLSDFFNPIKDLLRDYQRMLEKNKISLVEGAISFIHQIKEIDCMIVGVCNTKQLEGIYDAYTKGRNCEFHFDQFAIENDLFLNPSKWSI